MAQPLNTLVTIQEGTLAAMAADKRFLQEFPFLASLKQVPRRRGCGRCGSGAGVRADVFQAAKQVLAGLDSSKKQVLKRLLNAKGVRIIYRNANNQNIQLTF